MNDILFVCLIFFLCVRIFGFWVSIDFLLDKKDSKFILFSLGWGFWIVANSFAILYIIFKEDTSELLLILNVLFAAIGAILYAWGFFIYFTSLPYKLMNLLILITIILTIFLYFLDYTSIAVIFCNGMINVLIISAFIIPLLKKKKLKNYIGRSLKWYYATILLFLSYLPVTIINFVQGYGYGLYNQDNPVIILFNYVPNISASLLLIILLVHVEYNSSASQKFELKDKYSHNLGNILQTISSTFELIIKEAFSETELNKMNKLIMDKIKEASKLLKEIREIK